MTNIMTVLVWIFPFLHGMYFEYCGSIMTAVLLAVVIWKTAKGGGLHISLTTGMTVGIVLLFFSVFSTFFAVDKGISVTGIFKYIWPVLFLVLYQNVDMDGRTRIFNQIPYVGVALCLCGLVSYPFPALREYFFVNNRLSAGFGYANTLAVYLLVGAAVVLGRKVITRYGYIVLTILFAGIFFTGSRTVLVLTCFLVCYFLVRRREKMLFIYTAAVTALGLVSVLVIGNGVGLFGRILSISVDESTFVGRLLYASDALSLLWKHPFGMGHMGYYYMENSIQTGVYSVQYVHQDILQIGLDFGWIPMVFYVVSLIRVLLCRGIKDWKRVMLLVITVHGILDFDMAYGAVQCVVYMIMDECIWKKSFFQKNRQIKKPFLVGFVAVLLAAVYMSVPLLARYLGDEKTAVAWYPYDTESNLILLSETEDENEVKTLSDRILAQNDTCALVYYAKAMLADINSNYEQMIQYQKEAIARNYFDADEYTKYAVMLCDGLQYAYKTENVECYELCEKELNNIPGYMEEAEKRLSSLGRKINDQPELEVSDELQEILSAVN